MSKQQDAYLARRAAGDTMHTAAATSGIGLAEARLIENDIARGLLSLPDPAETPPPQKETTMAGKARSKTEEQNEEVTPDFARAIQVMTDTIDPSEEKNAKARGDLSAAWKVIEDDCHVNKKAAKDYHRLAGMSEELRDDYLRSLYGLMQEGGIGISQDLVDQMGDGEAPSMPVAKRGRGFGTEGLAALN